MTQVLRIGFTAAVLAIALASALAQSDSATPGSLAAVRGQAGNGRTAVLDKADVVARNGEHARSELGGASSSAPSGDYSAGRSATSQLVPADHKRAARLQELTPGNHVTLLPAARIIARRMRWWVPQRQRFPASASLASWGAFLSIRIGSLATVCR